MTEIDELVAWNNKRAVHYSDEAARAWRGATSGEERNIAGYAYDEGWMEHTAFVAAKADLPDEDRITAAIYDACEKDDSIPWVSYQGRLALARAVLALLGGEQK